MVSGPLQHGRALMYDVGTYEGNASNMYRIWCTIKEGLVTDAAGNEFDQVPRSTR